MHARDLLAFLSELTDNNQRAWFAMNQPRYEILRGEFVQLVAQLITAIGTFDPAVAGCQARKAVFRFHRDLRFARDKRPYKTTFSAAITASGLKRPSQGGGPMYYLQINALGKLMLAVGEFLPPPARLRQIRQHLVTDEAGFERLLHNRSLCNAYGSLRDKDRLVRVPKGFAADARHADYLRLKSFVVDQELELMAITSEQLVPTIARAYQQAYPLVAWLRTAG